MEKKLRIGFTTSMDYESLNKKENAELVLAFFNIFNKNIENEGLIMTVRGDSLYAFYQHPEHKHSYTKLAFEVDSVTEERGFGRINLIEKTDKNGN